jgi:hypothetical protein
VRYNIYRDTKSRERSGRESKVKSIEAETAFDAAEAFVKSLPKGGGWREKIIEVSRYGGRWQTADVWLRRYTPAGRYKGETHFMVWPES